MTKILNHCNDLVKSLNNVKNLKKLRLILISSSMKNINEY